MSDSFATPWTVDFPVHGIMQARIQDWVAISFSKEFSGSKDRIHVSCFGRQILYHWLTREALVHIKKKKKKT